MADLQLSNLLQQGEDAFRADRPHDSLELADRAIQLSPESSAAYSLRAISLGHLGHPSEADESFKRAIELDHANANACYNYAVFLEHADRKIEALEIARSASALAPGNKSYAQIVRQLEDELEPKNSAVKVNLQEEAPTERQAPSDEVRSGYNEEESSLPWVKNLGKNWLYMGIGVCVLSAICFAIVFPFVLSQAKALRATVPTGASPNIVTFLIIIADLGAVVWQVLDVVDRRANFFWILPNVICACAILNWISLPLYMLFGRKSSF